MQIDPRYVGHIFLRLGQRSFYLAPPQGETPDLQWLATAEVLVITKTFPNGIRYRTRNVRILDTGQATCDLVPVDRMQARKEAWLGPDRSALITKVILRALDGEATLHRVCGLYRVAA